jgi:hypothetical protein
MVRIVQPDRNELLRIGNTGTNAGLARHERQLGHIDLLDLGKASRRNGITINVLDDLGQAPDFAILVEDAGFFLALGAIAQKLHVSRPIVLRCCASGVDIRAPRWRGLQVVSKLSHAWRR